MNFSRPRHNFLLLFICCFLYGLLPIHQVVSITWFSVTNLDMYNYLHFHQILHHSKPMIPFINLKLHKTYLPKGYLICSNPLSSRHRSRCQNPQLWYHKAYAVDSLKVEIEAVKVEKGVLVIQIIISFSFWYDSCHHSTDLWAG